MKLQRMTFWLGCLVLQFALLSSIASGQTLDQQGFITNLYRGYFNRYPSPAELNEWMGWFARGATANDIHASFIGSEEYFNRHNRNPTSWINGVFATVTTRNPSPQEFSNWLQRYQILNQDRRRWGLDFLNTYGNRRPNDGWTSTPSQPSATPEARLVTDSRGLRDWINREAPGYQGAVVRMQANSLVTAAVQFEAAYRNLNQNPTAAQAAYRDVQASMTGVETSLRNFPGATNSRLYAANVSRDVNELGQQLNLGGTTVRPPGTIYPPALYPPIGSNPPPSANRTLNDTEAAQLNTLSYELSRELRSLYYLLRGFSQTDYRYRSLASDIQWYTSLADDFRSLVYVGSDRRAVRQSIRNLRDRGEPLGQRIQNSPVDVRVTQSWYQISSTLEQMAAVLGGRYGEPVYTPDNSFANRNQLLTEIDRASAECDGLLIAYNPYLLYGGSVQELLNNLRNLKNSLAVLRASTLNGGNVNQLRTNASAVTFAYRNVNRSWQNASAQIGVADSADLIALSDTITRINNLLR